MRYFGNDAVQLVALPEIMKHAATIQTIPLRSLVLLLVSACARLDTPEDDLFGTADMPQEALPVEAVLAEPERYLDQPVTVTGTVHEVCQNAGCWLVLRALDSAAGLRVHVARHEDGIYAYTVPQEISGRLATVHGLLQVADQGAEEHYRAESSAQPPGLAEAPKFEMVASGIRVSPKSSI